MRSTLLLATIVAAWASQVSAAFYFDPVVSAAFADDGAFTPLSSPPQFTPGVPAIYQIDVHVHADATTPSDLGVNAVAFHVDWMGLSGVVDFQPNPLLFPPGWIIIPPPLPPPPDSYLVSIPPQSPPFGQPGKTLLGSLFGLWDGVSPNLVTFDNIQILSANPGGQLPPIALFPVSLSLIPEPSAAFLTAVALLALLAFHRR